jgi:hypothetical protein
VHDPAHKRACTPSRLVEATPGPPNTSNLSQKLIGPLHFDCDGRCVKMWPYANDIYVCRECIDVQFDAPGLEKLKQREIDRTFCDGYHEFLHLTAWDIAGAQQVQEKKVLVGDQILGLEEWLEGIKIRWGLSDLAANTILQYERALL